MPCKECERLPVLYKTGRFYHWKDTVIEITACKKHWNEIKEVLNKAQDIGKRKGK